MKKQFNKVLGLKGELEACEYLKKNKYKVLEKNYKNKLGEIDIIAKKKDVLVFIEVKARDTLSFGGPSEAVNLIKQRKIKNVASLFLLQNHIENKPLRFDVIEVIDKEINHIENAF